MNFQSQMLMLIVFVAASSAWGDSWEPSLPPKYFRGLAFSPYKTGQQPGDPVTVAQVQERLGIVAPYTEWIRTYSMWNGFENIPEEANKLGLKLAAGTWIAHNREEEIRNLIEKARAGWVDLAMIGNEEVFSGRETDVSLAALLIDVRAALDANGLQHVPITTPEPFNTLFAPDGTPKCPNVLAAVDVVAACIYPFHDGIGIDAAVDALSEQYALAVQGAGGKEVLIAETGWPTVGEAKGEAVPSIENAAIYLDESVVWAESNGADVFTFEAFSEAWKGPEEIERNWGVWDADGVLKVPEPATFSVLFFGAGAMLWRRRQRGQRVRRCTPT